MIVHKIYFGARGFVPQTPVGELAFLPRQPTAIAAICLGQSDLVSL